MQKIFLNGKIHRATITSKNVEYEGSITIDPALMRASGIEEGELVQVVNVNNGARFETYVISGEESSGVISLNGAAARLGEVGDKVIIMSYAIFDMNEKRSPKVVLVDSKNMITQVL